MPDYELTDSSESLPIEPPKVPEVRKTHSQEFGWTANNALRINSPKQDYYPADIQPTVEMTRSSHLWQLGGVMDIIHEDSGVPQPVAVGDASMTFVHPERFQDYSLSIPTSEGYVTYTFGKEGDNYTITGPDGKTKIIKEGQGFTIGRAEQLDESLSDTWVSRKHAEFTLDSYGNPTLKVTGKNGAILYETPPPTEAEYAEEQQEMLDDAQTAVAEAFAPPNAVDIVATASAIAQESLGQVGEKQEGGDDQVFELTSASDLYNALIDGRLPASLESLIKNAIIAKRLESSHQGLAQKWEHNVKPQLEGFAGKGIDDLMDGYTGAINFLDSARNEVSASLRHLEEAFRSRDYEGVARIASSFLQRAEDIHQRLAHAKYRSKLADGVSQQSRSFGLLASEAETLGRQEKMNDADAGLPPEYSDIEEIYKDLGELFKQGNLEAVEAKLQATALPPGMKFQKKINLLMDLEATSNLMNRRFGINTELEGEAPLVRQLEDAMEMAGRIKRAVQNREELRPQLVIDLADFPSFFSRNTNHILDQLAQAKRSALTINDISREIK